jgi:hypothetical protein
MKPEQLPMTSEQSLMPESVQRPYFLWDYDLNNEQVRAILGSDAVMEKAWLVSRILQYARWDDIWRYLTLADIRQVFDSLRFRRPQDKELWAYALRKWSQHG